MDSPIQKEDWDDEVSIDNPDHTWRPWWWDRSEEAFGGQPTSRDPLALEERFADDAVETHGRWLITNGWASYYDQAPYDADPEDDLAPPSFSPLFDYDDATKADLVESRLAYGGSGPEPFTLPPSTAGGYGGSGGSGGSRFAASGTGSGSTSGDSLDIPPGVVAYARTGPGWTDTLQPPAGRKPDPSANPSTDPLDALAAAIAAGDSHFGGQAVSRSSGTQSSGDGPSPNYDPNDPNRIDPNTILPGGFGSGLGVAGTVGGFGVAAMAIGNGQETLSPDTGLPFDATSRCDCQCGSEGTGYSYMDREEPSLWVGDVHGVLGQEGNEVLRPVDTIIYAVSEQQVSDDDASYNTFEEWNTYFKQNGTPANVHDTANASDGAHQRRRPAMHALREGWILINPARPPKRIDIHLTAQSNDMHTAVAVTYDGTDIDALKDAVASGERHIALFDSHELESLRLGFAHSADDYPTSISSGSFPAISEALFHEAKAHGTVDVLYVFDHSIMTARGVIAPGLALDGEGKELIDSKIDSLARSLSKEATIVFGNCKCASDPKGLQRIADRLGVTVIAGTTNVRYLSEERPGRPDYFPVRGGYWRIFAPDGESPRRTVESLGLVTE